MTFDVEGEIYRIQFAMTINKLIWRVDGSIRIDELPDWADHGH